MKRETTIVITTTLALVLLGIVMVYSASEVNANLNGLLDWQIVCACIGMLALLIGACFDYHRLGDGVVFRGIVFFSMATLLLVLIPGVGTKVDGAQRWLRTGGFQFQPSEVAKFALILLLAVKLTRNREHVGKFWRGFLPPAIIAVVFSGLVLAERDLGVPAMMMGVSFVMLFVAGVRWRYLLMSVLPVVAAIWALIKVAPHRAERMVAFWDPWAHRDSSGWHLIQSFSGFARGGVWGQGIGAGEQKLGYLPAAHTDFIFSVIGEELGLVGTLITLGLFLTLLWAGGRIATHAQDEFGSLLAYGIVGLITLQTLFIMAVTTGLVPTKGIPLPFISYGGTALMVTMGLMGILVNIGVQAAEPVKERRLVPAV